MYRLLLVALVFLASASWATDLDLGDLTIDTGRVPAWTHLDDLPIDTSGWTEETLTDQGAATNTTNLQACVDDASPRICTLPSGTFQINAKINCGDDSSKLIRGQGRDSTTLQQTDTDQPAFQCLGSPSDGSSLGWTSGYTLGTTTVGVTSTAGISNGDWVKCTADHPTDRGYTWTAGYSWIAKVSSFVANTSITLDRPLTTDYNTANQDCVEWTPGITNIAWEDMTIKGGNDVTGGRSIDLRGAAESWIVDVKHIDIWSVYVVLGFEESARVLVRGNWFTDFATNVEFGKGALRVNECHGCVFENNIFEDTEVALEFQRGTTGSVFAYNYVPDPGAAAAVGCERSAFIHGRGGSASTNPWPSANLVEGNDFQCALQTDDTWASSGDYHTIFRNRVRGTGTGMNRAEGSISREITNGDHWNQNFNYIGNISYTMGTHPDNCPGGGATKEIDICLQSGWFERNVVRNACTLDSSSGGDCTDCGDLAEPSILHASCQEKNSTWTNNDVGNEAKPAGWSAFNFPKSLYRSAIPTWWCDEACEWSTTDGIGAAGDDFATTLCKLPAQIEFESGTCSAVSEGGGYEGAGHRMDGGISGGSMQ